MIEAISNVASIVKTSWETDFIDDDSDVHTEISEFHPVIWLKIYHIIEKQLPSVCKPTHIVLQKPQFHALMTNFCVLNEHKVQRLTR